MTPLERAMAAIGELPFDYEGATVQLTSVTEKSELADIVRAVLRAIREPSEAMIVEAYESYSADNGSLRDVYMSMIDAALEEK